MLFCARYKEEHEAVARIYLQEIAKSLHVLRNYKHGELLTTPPYVKSVTIAMKDFTCKLTPGRPFAVPGKEGVAFLS